MKFWIFIDISLEGRQGESGFGFSCSKGLFFQMPPFKPAVCAVFIPLYTASATTNVPSTASAPATATTTS
jgi:hypothetical protein